jgi:hypothetical protein
MDEVKGGIKFFSVSENRDDFSSSVVVANKFNNATGHGDALIRLPFLGLIMWQTLVIIFSLQICLYCIDK